MAISNSQDIFLPTHLSSGKEVRFPILHDLESWHEVELVELLFALAYEEELNSEEQVDLARRARNSVLAGSPEVISDLLAFLHDRLKVYLRDRGIRHDVIDACLAMPNSDDLTLLVARVTALQGFLDGDDGTNLLQGYKRANNILRDEEKKDGVEYALDPDVRLAEGGAEKALFAALDVAEGLIGPALKAEDFGAAMAAMAALRGPIDGFFDGVMVNAANSMVRRNRLCLLHRIRAVMGKVADFGVVESPPARG